MGTLESQCGDVNPVTKTDSQRKHSNGRLLGSLAFLSIGLVWWQLDQWTLTHRAIRWLSVYSPSRFAHGAIWTLPLSALLVGHIALVGVTVTFFVAVVVPYLVVAGPTRALVAFAVAHVGATMAAFVIISAGAALGIGWGHRLWVQNDYGASAGLLGIAGALFFFFCSQRRWLAVRVVGLLAAAASTAFFLHGVIAEPGPGHGIVDVEHLLGLLIGGMLEWWHLRRPCRAGRSRSSATRPVAVGADSHSTPCAVSTASTATLSSTASTNA